MLLFTCHCLFLFFSSKKKNFFSYFCFFYSIPILFCFPTQIFPEGLKSNTKTKHFQCNNFFDMKLKRNTKQKLSKNTVIINSHNREICFHPIKNSTLLIVSVLAKRSQWFISRSNSRHAFGWCLKIKTIISYKFASAT